jgi:hypothetical protein
LPESEEEVVLSTLSLLYDRRSDSSIEPFA